MASLLTSDELDRYIAGLKANQCRVHRDNAGGTVTAHDGDEPVLRAIQKGRGGPWIVRFIDSSRITWAPPKG